MRIYRLCNFSDNTISLRALLEDANDDEIIWTLINYNDLEQELPIKPLENSRLHSLISATSGIPVIQSFEENANKHNWEIVNHYIKHKPLNNIDDIVILEGDRVIDGHHRIVAAIKANYSLQYVDLLDLEEN